MTALKLVKEHTVEVTTIATSAVLIDLTISTWVGRKRDKTTTAEVVHNKNAGSSKSASVIKNLMSDDADLDKIRAYAQDTRIYLNRHTFAWNDGGTRLLPTGLIFEVTNEMEGRQQEFDKLAAIFLAGYSTKVSAAAFKLGQLFNRNEYPDVEMLRRKFNMRYVISPVPTSGDFRVDVQNDVGEFLKKQYIADAESRLVTLMREPWQRVYEQLTHVRERIEATMTFEQGEVKDGRRTPKLYQSLIDNSLELVTLLDKMNITKDPQLAECTANMRRLFGNMDIRSVRESKDQQMSVKKQVDDLLNKFDFSGFGDD